MPARGSAGLNNHADVVAQRCIDHFFQIGRRHSALALQVGSAHVDHHGDGPRAGSIRKFRACARIHGAVRLMRLVNLLRAGGGRNLTRRAAVGAEQRPQRIRDRTGGIRGTGFGRRDGVRTAERALRRAVTTEDVA
ncbi:hypothetical protein SDC9_100066 [bioreactor metagenome]|uniref:Uncharacterized protein n=1 Tax=bioreactor metagenome TaxID=1076179 RepID=A0A645AJG9_9ZZZZ